MSAWLTKFGPALFALLKKGISSLAYFAVYVSGRRSQRKDDLERDVKAQKEYGRIASEHRTPDDAVDRLRGGNF